MDTSNFYQSRRPRLAQAKRSSPFKSTPQVAAKKVKPSPAPKKTRKVRLVKKKAAITLNLLPASASCTAGLGDAEIRALKIRLTATEAQVSVLTQERASMRLAQQTAESERASMRLALQTAESEWASIRLALQTAESERASTRLAPQLDIHLDTSVCQPRRRLFGFHEGDADPQPLQPDVPTQRPIQRSLRGRQ
ncbi:hypothetical protein JOQ06_001617 [Pogonophryne albipinna]|uniref:Uncharacterized protein n=1 Tax=Pogonophryne albipinna TaxID=1090488 RepID=A0AAD6B5F2_9TELE|nr:hypothetical protein JOQ06_001617 [Pogonophryne albipinna]